MWTSHYRCVCVIVWVCSTFLCAPQCKSTMAMDVISHPHRGKHAHGHLQQCSWMHPHVLHLHTNTHRRRYIQYTHASTFRSGGGEQRERWWALKERRNKSEIRGDADLWMGAGRTGWKLQQDNKSQSSEKEDVSEWGRRDPSALLFLYCANPFSPPPSMSLIIPSHNCLLTPPLTYSGRAECETSMAVIMN